MADEDEYVYRLGLDAREFVDGINQALTALGDFDDRVVAKMPKDLRDLSQKMSRVGKDIRDAVGGKTELSIDDKKALAAEKRQTGQISKLKQELKELGDGYARFQRESARGSGVPGGLDISKASEDQLKRIVQVQKALGANGAGATSPVASAAQGELTKRANQAKKLADAEANAVRQGLAQQQRDQDRADRAKIAADRNATSLFIANQRRQDNAARDAARQQEMAARNQERAAQQLARNYEAALPRVRYVLYDIANTAAVAGAATLGVGAGILKTAADYESAYAQVKRTSDILTDPSLNQSQKDDRYADLRKDLVSLSEQIPQTFQDLSEIAKTGNQLGIASTDIANFTETTAKFSAVTGVDVTTAATAFGRLGEVLDDQNYKRIGDEIAYLGVRSVATEQDIISTASQLAVAGQGIKLTTQDVLALSTTVAGLGVKPEQARGTFIRAFSQIGTAVNSGGASLNNIAKLSGLTADQFKADFNAGGDSAYGAFLKFTRGLGTSSASINSNLASIGITAVRDRQTLGLLAQNGGRALKDLENAAKGSRNGFLDTAFEVQATTISSKLITLGNTFKAVMDGIGQSSTGPLAHILDGAQHLLELIQKITASPLASWTLAILTGLTLLAGAGLLAGAALSRFFGFVVALNQINALAVNGQTGLAAAMAIVRGEAQQTAGVTGILASTNDRLAISTLKAAGTQEVLASSLATRTTAAVGKTTGAFGKFTSILGKAGVIGGVIALVAVAPSLVVAIQSWADELSGATRNADDLEKKLESLKGKAADQNLQDLLKALPGGQGSTIGDFIGSGFRNPLGAGDGKGGFQTDKGKTVNGTQGAVNKITSGQKTPGDGVSFLNGSAQFDQEVTTQLAKIKQIDTALTDLYREKNTAGFKKGYDLYITSMAKQGVSAKDAKAALIDLTAAEKGAGEQATESAERVANFGQSLSGVFDTNIQAQQVTSDLTAVGQAVSESGAKVGLSGQAMKTAITDIFASTDDNGVAKGRLQSLYNQLAALGYAAPLLKPLKDAIDSITGSATASPIAIDAFNKGLDTSEQKVRTLSDYASDLQGVLSRAFDIRFGNQEALDKVNQGWKDMGSSIKDAREEVRKAKADLASLQADQNVNKYQLGVAEQFGDTARAAVLRADIAKNAADQASKRKDIASDSAKASTALTGNSAGAIGNRQNLLGQIQNSQSYIQSLAANGSTPAQIQAAIKAQKQQFIQQATSAGFSRKEVVKLAAAYDDMNKVVSEVPRKITTKINSNAGPAKTAVDEYRAALKKTDGTVVRTAIEQTVTTTQVGTSPAGGNGTTGTQPLPGILRNPTAPKPKPPASIAKPGPPKFLTDPNAVYPNYWKTFNRLYNTSYQSKPSANEVDLWIKYLKGAGVKLPKGYRQGGYTGALPTWQKAGDVHGDEFVLNSRGYKMFPRQMLEGANHGVAPVIPRVTATATLGPGATVSLSPQAERALIASQSGGAITVRSDRIGSAIDQAFTASDRRGSA